MATYTSPSHFFIPTTAPAYTPTSVFPPSGLGAPASSSYPAPAYSHYTSPAAAIYPPTLFPGGYPSFNSPNWPPPAPDPPPASTAPYTFPSTTTSSPTAFDPFPYESCYPTSEATSVPTYVEPNWPPSPHPQTGTVLPPPTPANPPHPSSLPSPAFLTTTSMMQSVPALQLELHDSVSPTSPRRWISSLLELPGLAPLLELPNANSRLLTEMEPGNTAASSAATPALITTVSAEAQAHTEAGVSEHMPSLVLDIKRRLDAHQYESHRSFDSLRGELSTLRDRLSSLTNSMVPSSASSTSTAPTSSVGFTPSVAREVFVEMPQSSGFQNLNRRSVFLSDGTEHSYYVLPEDYPLESSSVVKKFGVMAPLAVKAQATGLPPVPCTQTDNAASLAPMLVHNLQPTMTAQDTPSVCKEIPVYDTYEEDGASLNIISDVWDLSLKLQQQDGDRARNCPALNSYNSDVTRSTQLCIEPSELRLLWDPGASTLLVTPLKNLLLNEMGREVWDPGDHSILSSALNKDTSGVLQSSILPTSGILTLSYVLTVGTKFRVPTSVPQQRCYCRVPSSHESYEFHFLWDPGIHTVLRIKDTMLDKCVLPNEVQFVQDTFELSLLILEAVILYYATNGVNYVPHGISFTLQRATHFSQGMFVMAEIHLNGNELKAGQLTYMPQGTSINSSEWLGHMVAVLSFWSPSFEMAKLQWEPGVGTPSSMYLRLQGLTARIAIVKPLSGLQISELALWQRQVTNASYVWDPGTVFLQYKSIWLLLLTEEKENAMHYCQIFQRCTAMISLFHCHGIPLWLINFQVP